MPIIHKQTAINIIVTTSLHRTLKKLVSTIDKIYGYSEVRKSIPSRQFYNKIYNLLNARRKRAENTSNNELINNCNKELTNFRNWYNELEKKYKHGYITEKDFTNSLVEKHLQYKKEFKNNKLRNS